MTSSSDRRFSQLDAFFAHAVQIPEGSDREAYLKNAFAADDSLERDLRTLLAADAALNRLAAPPVRLPQFGPYQARELIGRGGMGAVYRATREDGQVRQEVAIKVVESAIWSPEAEERFRRERQILAELNHRHIARFLDVGVTGDGAPYRVMTYIAGERIDRWCDRDRLPLRQRLELFLKVSDAVSFAYKTEYSPLDAHKS